MHDYCLLNYAFPAEIGEELANSHAPPLYGVGVQCHNALIIDRNSAELGTCGIFHFQIMKNGIFCIFYQMNLIVFFLNKPGPEIAYFYSQTLQEVTFSTTLQNRKPQMPSSGQILALYRSRQILQNDEWKAKLAIFLRSVNCTKFNAVSNKVHVVTTKKNCWMAFLVIFIYQAAFQNRWGIK